MYRSIKQIYGDKLGASDGEIGQVKDFYFDDRNWAIRYLVVDTGTWLPGRQVLLSPHAVGRLDQAGKILRVNLTRKQIESSPSIATHKPVSRQYEEEYYRYFGWPYYWQGDGLWGISGVPILESPAVANGSEPVTVSGPLPEQVEPHLRSTQAVNGYHLRTTDKVLGHVCDFMVDAQSWVIGQLAIKTGHRLSGKELMIPTKMVDRISYEDSTVFLNVTAEAVEQSPQQELVPVPAVD